METPLAVIVIDCSVAAVTVSATLFEVTPLCVAEIKLDPAEIALTEPAVTGAATAGFEEFQITDEVTSWVLPSVKVPIAVNWSVVPFATVPLWAVTVIACSTAAPLKFTEEIEAPLITTA
jgi:hypothetical protein